MRPVVIIALLSLALPVQAKPGAKLYRYRVQRGDTCWNIAIKLFGEGKKYELIHRFNRLGPMPHILQPGLMLNLPRSGNVPEARLVWFKKSVKAKSPRSVDWLTARRNMSLWRMYRVITGDDSSAGIRFEDDTFLQMRPRGLLVIYGGSKTLARTKRVTKNKVLLEQGVLKGGLKDLFGNSTLTVKTPSSEIKVESKQFQIEVTRKKSSIISVFNGKAEVKAKGSTVIVKADQGVRVDKGKRPSKPRPLPKAPKWFGKAGRLIVFAPSGHRGYFSAQWMPVHGATRYHVTLARNPRFVAPMVDTVVGAAILKLRAQDLQPADYFARVSAIDRARMEGRPSATLTVSVLPLKTSRALLRAKDGTYETAGLLSMRPPDGAEAEIAIGQGPFKPFRQPVRLMKPGTYALRFRHPRSLLESRMRVRLLGVSGVLRGPDRALQIKGAGAPVELSIRDERGRPVALPGIRLRAFPGGTITLRPTTAGVYRGQIPAPQRYSKTPVKLWAAWLAGDLATLDVPIQPPPIAITRKVRVPVFVWPDDPVGLEWAMGDAKFPSMGARPFNRVSLLTGISRLDVASRDGSTTASDRQVFLRTSLAVGLALAKGRVGIDLDLPWLVLSLQRDSAGQGKIGDVRAAVRWLALERAGWLLTPYFRLGAPTGRYQRTRKDWIPELGLILQKRFGSVVGLHTMHSLVAQINEFSKEKTLFRYSGVAGLTLRLGHYFSAGGELAALLGQGGDGSHKNPIALLANLSARLHLGRFRLGLLGGAFLVSARGENVGQFALLFTVDFGFWKIF